MPTVKTSRTVKRVTAQKVRATPSAKSEPLPDRSTIGGRLVMCRLAKGISQAEAARTLGIRAQSLGGLELGPSKQPASDTLLDMRDKLGYDIDFVMKGKGMPLMPNFEELAREMALIAIFRELRPDIKDEAVRSVQALRRAQGGGASGSDPWLRDAPPSPQPGDDD